MPARGDPSWVVSRQAPWERLAPSTTDANRQVVDRPRDATLEEVALAASFLLFAALIALGLLLWLFSWVTTGLPPGAVTCPHAETCVQVDVPEDPTRPAEVSPAFGPTASP